MPHGRESALEVVRAFLTRALERGGTLLLSGEPGAGTAVLDAAADLVTDAVVLRAEGVELEEHLVRSGLHQVLLPVMTEIAGVCPAHRAALSVALGLEQGPSPDDPVLGEAVLALLRRVGRERPVLILIDDLDRVDRSSAAVLDHVGHHLDGSRIGLLATVRSGTGPLAGDRLPRLELGPPDIGSPGAAPDPRMPTPTRLRGLVARIGDLPATARRFLLLAALDGSGDLDLLLGSVAPVERAHLVRSVAAARLLRIDEQARTVHFPHPVVRSTAVDLATSRERAGAHQTLAELLAHRPDRRAWHRAGAAGGPDEEVARTLQGAATDALRRGDAVDAVGLALRAADLTPPGPGRRRRMARAASLVAEVTGDLRAVPRLLGEGTGTEARHATSLPAALATARLLLLGDGDVDAAHRLLVRAVETADVAAGDDTLVEALHTLLTACTFGGRAELWGSWRRLVAGLGTPVPDTLELATAGPGDAARAPASVNRVAVAAEGLHLEADPRRIVRVALAASDIDRVEDCRDALWRVVRDGRAGGAVASGIHALLVLASDARHSGRWDEARDLASEALARCLEHGYQLLAAPARLCLALLAAARGDGAAVISLTDELISWGVPRGARKPVVDAGWARTLAALGRGDFEDAYQEAVAVNPPGALDRDDGHVPWMGMDLVEAAVATRRDREAAAHVAVLRDVGAAAQSPRLALHAAGAAAIAAPQHLAGDLYEAALALPAVERWPFDLARVRLAHGEHLRRARSTRAARAQLSRALEVFDELGARPWAARATVELRASGRDPSPVIDAPRLAGRASLTAQEREVAGLAASGMTNREIADRLRLSRRTVDAHLYRTFPKLHITGRAALRDALERNPG